MQIIIDIHEKDLECLKRTGQVTYSLISSVLNGTVLPEGHGDLIDRNEIKRKYKSDGNWNLHKAVDSMPTVIEADIESDQ